MAASSVSLARDEFSCSVCLDLLKNPVTIPCGHSYCMSCITGYWDQKRVYSCPQCRQTFTPRPVLGKNTILAEVLEKLKKTKRPVARPAQCYSGSGDVECDVCTGRKYKAIKSCLVCLESYCQTHFERHEEFHSGKRHKLTDATGQLQEMICPQHDKLLEIFCRTDQQCICYMCMIDEHKDHNTVSAAAERTEKQRHLEETQRTNQQGIQERQKKLDEIRETVESYKRSAQTAVEDSERIFTDLIRCIERSRSEVTQLIRDQEKAEVSRAEEQRKRLEQEIEDLRRRDAELEQLSHTDDHIHFLQRFQSLSIPPGSTDSPSITVSSRLSFDDVERSVFNLREKLEHFCREEIEMLSGRVRNINIIPTSEPETREDFLQYSRQLTLDPNTVNKNLVLSEENRMIDYNREELTYPDHPDRFDGLPQVLCRERVCGRCYWEVEWSGWVGISVSYKSISRKGWGKECEFGCNDQSWCLFCSDSSCSFWHNNKQIKLPVVSSSSRIGVYVDHSAGTLSFYSVSDTMILIHRVQTTFTQLLYPGIWANKFFKGLMFFFSKATLGDLTIQFLDIPTLITRKCFSSEKSVLNCCQTVVNVSLPVSACSTMAESSISVAQDQFSCSICLDLLKDPVTIPCGHSYCMSCITGCWDQKRVYSCPQCRQTFTPRPVLGKNTMLAEVVEKLKKIKLQDIRPAQCYSGSGDVECDVCTGDKNKAVKSCLDCLNSYCQNHLEQHERFFKSKKHNLMDATGRLQEMICPQHDKLLEIFCRTDQQCICYLCMLDEHKTHETVSAAAERTEKQRQLGEMQRKFQQRIQERQKELKEAVESHKHSAQTAVEDSERIFTDLIRCIERSRSEVTRLIRDQEKAEVSRAEQQLKRLEQEIEDLSRRDTELEKLSHTDDHIHFLQRFQSLSVPPGSTDSPSITVSSRLSFGDVGKSMSRLREKLEHFCREEIEMLSGRVRNIKIITSEPETREDFLQYSRQLTLDPSTVNKNLVLSEKNRVIKYTFKAQPYPNHPDRFDGLPQVLCRERVCGRCYWEVEWSGWVGISVSYKSISRKGWGKECEFGCNDQSWSLFCSDSSCSFWHNNKQIKLPVVSSSSRIGVYVDHSAGTLSFYSVSDTVTLIHRVQTTFTQPLYAGIRTNLCFEDDFDSYVFCSTVTVCDLKI
ncbi:uncharacterized protein LOC131528575 [Onychostoma macrolepis]|uniref:uncharacterized protein LOC131528575 n=1 Tax=Onychostoma macrolepis TaxID=369639 RepID=UPI00272CE23B|nr:uncharacterized protein LOC131528575 [Onychostoma macrolepis]